MPTVAEEWMTEGEAKGLAEGLMRGRAESKAESTAETPLGLPERRFGAVPEDASARILAAPAADVDA